MYAIVEIAGHQFKVEKDQKVFVNRLQTEEGKKVTFDNVLLLADGGKKRRKGYRVKNGHRQSLTEIQIESIGASGAKKAAPAKAAAPKAKPAAKKEASKPAAKAAAPKAEAAQDLSAMTVAQLKELAKAKGISGISAMKKSDLISALS